MPACVAKGVIISHDRCLLVLQKVLLYHMIDAFLCRKRCYLSHDTCLLVDHGGDIKLSGDCARNMRYKMKEHKEPMIRRVGNTASLPVAPALLAETKLAFQYIIKVIKEAYNIPYTLILNLEQTPLAYPSTQNHPLEVKGTTSIPIVGKGKHSKLPVHSHLQKMGLSCQCS